MTELSFLLELLFEYKIPKIAQVRIKDRIKELEEKPQAFVRAQIPIPTNLPPHLANQSPSTIARLVAHGMVDNPPIPDGEQPPAPIIVSQAASAAMKARQDAIRAGMSEKPEPGRTSPRKF